MEINVGANRPRLLEPDAPAPEPDQSSGLGAPVQQLEAGPYWTADKASRVFAEAGKALSKLYGPEFRMSSIELDLVGQPAANVLNDYAALPSGPAGDKLANLLALLAVLALLVALRLPSVLEAHDLLPRWAWARRQRERERQTRSDEVPPPQAAYAGAAAAAPAPPRPPAPFAPEPEPAAQPAGWDRGKWDKFGPTTVGGGGEFVTPRSAA